MISPKKTKAFTLIELLTVIAIIAVLMGLLFPAIASVKESARKTQAKNDEMQIVNAVKAYYTEYGKYPIDTTSGAASDFAVRADTDNSKLIDMLRNNINGPNSALVAKMNPRQIVFFEAPLAAGYGTAVEKGGIGSTKPGWYFDPWGTSYGIAMDGDYDNRMSKTTHGYGDANFATLDTGVIVWSYGKDKKAGKNGAPTFAGSDDVVSWQ